MRPSQGLWGTGEKGHLFQGNKGQILRGTGEQKQYWGTVNIRKQIFAFGEQGNKPIYFRGTGTPWEVLNGPVNAHLISGSCTKHTKSCYNR